ncbi:MAG TPA: bifunctional enoyl-CoA hydratase/phosphate acetyltransferase [Alphaproteobacteria bacterium]|nr:bifunctional enoyl-CoA hydratase/phosphate acetyltransferase [Alphaproteobacteria bacterium]
MAQAASSGSADTADVIENRTFDEIKIGDSASLTRTLTADDIALFAVMSGDVNPAHLDQAYAEKSMFHHIIAHGMWGGALISAVLGTKLPGPGTIYLGQDLKFRKPVGLGDTITVTVTAKEKRPEKHVAVFDCCCRNQSGEDVITGTATTIAPTEKIRRPRIALPEIQLRRHDKYQELLTRCASLEPISTAVVHPCDRVSLEGAVRAAEVRLIVPVLVGPQAKIQSVAAAEGLDIARYEIVDTEHSHAAAAKAVALARAGKVEALMKGSLHTDELMHEVTAAETGLRTARRISHAFIMDVPGHPTPLIITDAAVNIFPTLDDKRDICQNAIDLARALGFETPRVAVLSAVETVTAKIPSTLDATALCKMADRRQITGGLVDGPLAFDNAVSEEAAKEKGIVSPVAGKANILLVPDLVSGNMVAKQLTYLAHADAAGIVLGARVPIILTSRADNLRTRMASAAVAVLLAHARRQALPRAMAAE